MFFLVYNKTPPFGSGESIIFAVAINEE